MGTVEMGSRQLDFLHDGYPINLITYYVYCDTCGSFQIRSRLTRTTLIVTLVGLAAVLAIVLAVGPRLDATCGAGLGVIAVFVAILASGERPKDPGRRSYVCLKCGNTEISDRNVLDYRKYDKTILDLREDLVVKYEAEDLYFHDR